MANPQARPQQLTDRDLDRPTSTLLHPHYSAKLVIIKSTCEHTIHDKVVAEVPIIARDPAAGVSSSDMQRVLARLYPTFPEGPEPGTIASNRISRAVHNLFNAALNLADYLNPHPGVDLDEPYKEKE